MMASPKLEDSRVESEFGAFDPPVAYTDLELHVLVTIAHARRARTIVVGTDTTASALAAGTAFVETWQLAGGIIADQVQWPQRAASWLRPAQRLTRHDPDLWVMTGSAAGWAQMVRRLHWSTRWDPARTLAFGSVAVPTALILAGIESLEGLIGATSYGVVWGIVNGRYVEYPPERREQ